MTAICPRCGEEYPADKPILRCKVCNLEIGKEKNGEIVWNSEMEEPIPSCVYHPDRSKVFAGTLRWYYLRWIKPYKDNPSSKIGKV